MKSFCIAEKFWSVLKLLLIVGLSMGIGVCITMIHTLNEDLRERDRILVSIEQKMAKYEEPNEYLIQMESLCERESSKEKAEMLRWMENLSDDF